MFFLTVLPAYIREKQSKKETLKLLLFLSYEVIGRSLLYYLDLPNSTSWAIIWTGVTRVIYLLFYQLKTSMFL